MITKNRRKPRFRKDLKPPNNYVLGFYGRLILKGYCKWYCDLHKCYLVGKDLKERKCMIKKCSHLKTLGKYKDIEEVCYEFMDKKSR